MTSTPIPIIRVTLDELHDVPVPGARDGQRVWIEVSREGQVVGVVEALTDAGYVRATTLVERTRLLEKVVVESFEPLADAALPSATVVVPTICQDPERLAATIDQLSELDYPRFDIVVVDNRPDPLRSALPEFRDHARVRTYWEPHRGVSAARNKGIDEATGDIVAFTDDDVFVERHWLRELVTRFVRSPEVDAVSGLVLPLELRTDAQLWFEEFFGGFNSSFSEDLMSLELLKDDPLFPYATGRFGAGCNMAVRRSALDSRGGFDVTLGVGTPSRGGEDLAMLMKQVLTGGTVAFEPRAIVRHQHRETPEQFFSQVFGYGVGLSAMFTELIIRDPRHLWRMARRLPGGLRLLTKPREERSPSLRTSYPKGVFVKHVLGMAFGPIAYAQSVARERRGRAT